MNYFNGTSKQSSTETLYNTNTKTSIVHQYVF